MAEQDSLEKFLTAIKEETEQQRQATKRQTGLFVAAELEKAEDDVLKESYFHIQKSATAIRKKEQIRLSEAIAENERNYLLHREKIMNDVVNKTKELLNLYTDSEDYKRSLELSAEKIKECFGTNAFTLFVCEKDKKFSKNLKNISCATMVEVDNSIEIGGLKAENKAHTLRLDDTLDSRLDQKKQLLRLRG